MELCRQHTTPMVQKSSSKLIAKLQYPDDWTLRRVCATLIDAIIPDPNQLMREARVAKPAARKPPRRRRATQHRNRRVPGKGRLPRGPGIPGPAVVALVACPLLILLTAAGWLLATKNLAADPVAKEREIRAHLVIQAPTQNDASVAMPSEVRAALREIGLSHGQIEVDHIGATGEVQSQIVDLTPRVSDAANAQVIKVQARALEAIDRKLDALLAQEINPPAEQGNRALYTGLLKINFGDSLPVFIVSSLLDLTDPVDTRALSWDVSPESVLDSVGEVPGLKGAAVIWVVVPPASDGPQERLRQEQSNYLKNIWKELLMTGGDAASLSFLEPPGGPSAGAIGAPTVPLPDLPDTPIKPEPGRPGYTECRVGSSYFKPNSAKLLDPQKTRTALAGCVAAIPPGTRVDLDGWTAWFGALDDRGNPVENPDSDIALSRDRAWAIQDLLKNMGVDQKFITVNGHGNDNQPNPDPKSPFNRVVVITIHGK